MRPFPPSPPSDYLWLRVSKRRLKLGLLAVLSAALVLAAARRPLLTAAGDWLQVRIPCRHADALVVLAGDPGERVAHAVGLYRKGVAPNLLMSGGPTGGTSWAEIMKQQAMKLGVPERDIWIQDRSGSTTEDARLSLPVLKAHGVTSVCLVTSCYHSRRAAATFRKILPAGCTLTVDPEVPDWWQERPWWRQDMGRLAVFSEYVKLAWSACFGAEY